jgi:putative transcriptional regulator
MKFRQITLAAFAAGFLCPGALCRAQQSRPEELAPGKILVTPREAPDPLFARSVIVLAHYDRNGALGLMIQYRSKLTLQRALAGIKGAKKRDDPLYVGGPVELESVMALLRSKAPPDGAERVAGDLYLISSRQGIENALSKGRAASDLRVFVGYTGWGAGQLPREVQLGGWNILSYNEKYVFDDHPETLWERLIEKTGLSIATLR